MIKALIVDDEEWIRIGIREDIDWKGLGIEIIGEAQNGEAAKEIINANCPDIVLTDVRMPVMDGIKLMEYLHNEYPDVIVIVISGYSEFEYAKKAISFKAFDYVLKPIEEKELEQILKNAVEKLREKSGGKNILSYIDELYKHGSCFTYPNEKTKTFLFYIENSHKEQAFELIQDLFSKVEADLTVVQVNIRNTVFDFVIFLNKLLQKYSCSLETLLDGSDSTSKIIIETHTIKQLKDWFEDVIDRTIDYIANCRKAGTKKAICEIKEYVTAHYFEDISLNFIAESYFINPAYLSRVFKSESGLNFNDFLTNIRMNKASELLNNPVLKMNDIAEMVGYQNVNYFLRKFKEFFGCTPSEHKSKKSIVN